jgi:alkylhydroperoxidase family enzyme
LELLDGTSAASTHRERLAVAYTRSVVAESNSIPEKLFAALKEAFTDPELVELTFLIGYINMLNLFNNALNVRYHGEYRALKPSDGSP